MPSVVRRPVCQNRKNRRAKRASPCAPARADAGSDPPGAWGCRGALARSRSAHARGRPRELPRPRPRFLSQNHPQEGRRRRRRVPGAGANITGRRRRAAGPGPAPLSPAPGQSRIPFPAAPRGPGRATLYPRLPGRARTVLTVPLPLPTTTRLGPGSREGAEGSTVEPRSEDPAWSNRTRTPEREWGPVGRGRRGEGELQKIPEPAALASRGTVPPPLPAWDQLPSCSQRKNQSRPCSSAGTSRSPGLPRLRPAIPRPRTPPYPDTTPQELSRRGDRSRFSPSPGSRARLLPSGRFQIEIPWLGPSENPRASPAPSRRKPLPRPRRTRPRHQNPLEPRHAPRPRPRPRARARGPSPGIP